MHALFLLIITISLLILFLLINKNSDDFSENYPRKLLNINKASSNKSNDHLPDKIMEHIQNTTDFSFIHVFIASISVIVVSEIGDKTFFIAAIMAMHYSFLIIYTGAMSALGTMTIISALLGNVIIKFIPTTYTYFLSSMLFLFFGVKMLKDGYNMSSNEGTNEYKNVQHEIEQEAITNELKSGRNNSEANNSIKENQQNNIVTIIHHYLSPIFIRTFIMTFLAVSRM